MDKRKHSKECWERQRKGGLQGGCWCHLIPKDRLIPKPSNG